MTAYPVRGFNEASSVQVADSSFVSETAIGMRGRTRMPRSSSAPRTGVENSMRGGPVGQLAQPQPQVAETSWNGPYVARRQRWYGLVPSGSSSEGTTREPWHPFGNGVIGVRRTTPP